LALAEQDRIRLVFENLQKAAEATIQAQQEMFRKWVNLSTGLPPAPPAWGEQGQKFQKKWNDTVAELVKKQRETLEAQFSAGLRNIEESFRLAEASDPEEFRAKMLELWSKSFDYLRQMAEAQLRQFQTAMEKWTEIVTKNESACGV
jgi:hypothetical protein